MFTGLISDVGTIRAVTRSNDTTRLRIATAYPADGIALGASIACSGPCLTAVEIAREHRPWLILADINLGAGGDGASAVSRIVRHHRAPVIFVTAYPERLLTGEAMEPAFVITKPFEPMTLAIATYQAVTGGVHLD